MSAQLRPIAGQAPQRPDADAIRRDAIEAVNRRLTDEIAPQLKTELIAEINSRFLDLTARETAWQKHNTEWQTHSLRAERWRATAISGVAGLVAGSIFVWMIYSGAALTGGAIANTDRNLDRLEAATNDLKR